MRFSADPVCRALLSRLDRPLLASIVPCEVDGDGIEYAQDPAVMCDDYESEGLLAFVIDCGVRENPPSTVIDLSGGAAKLLRRGAGDASAWVEDDEEETLADEEDAWGFS